MGWIQMLEKTYDACESIVGKKVNEDPILLPISHSTANAQLEVTIDMDGKFYAGFVWNHSKGWGR